jgi:hypothetical protein
MWQMPDYELLESRRTLRHGLFDLTPSLIEIGVGGHPDALLYIGSIWNVSRICWRSEMTNVHPKLPSQDLAYQPIISDTEIEENPSVSIDVKRFQRMIDDPNLSEEEKREVVLALWSLLITFVDLKFTLRTAKPNRQ